MSDTVLQDFLNQTFSTTEAASILEIPVETLRTQLKQNWLPVSGDREPGKWRRLTPEDLLRIRLAFILSDRGLPFPEAKRIIWLDRPDFRRAVFFCVGLTSDKKEANPCGQFGVEDFRKRIGLIATDSPATESVIVIPLNPIRNWIRNRIAEFKAGEVDQA